MPLLAIRVQPTNKLVTLSFTDQALFVIDSTAPKRPANVPIYQVIGARYSRETRILELSYAHRVKKFSLKGGLPGLSFIKLVGQTFLEGEDVAMTWADTLMHTVYESQGINRRRRLKILVNPHGGTGRGVAVFKETLTPIFEAANCILDTTFTTHSGHAHQIAKDMSLDYDAIITVSGDGLIHEVMNGLALSKYPTKALRIPICPIPTGSGNGLSLNLLGLADGFDIVAAALNAIKGLPMPVDVFSFVQNEKRTLSFMSQALGLWADLDIGTDHLRFMGDTRFMYGLFRGLAHLKSCNVTLSYKLVEADKIKMARAVQNRAKSAPMKTDTTPDSEPSYELPPLEHLSQDTDGWTTLDLPLLYVYAGKGPFVGRDLMAFPVSLPDDGLVDIMVQEVCNRGDVLKHLGGGPQGALYWDPKVHYFKASAYRVQPHASTGNLAIDGEKFPFEAFQVEVHRGLATLLSPFGHYAAEFPIPDSVTKATAGK